MTIEFENSIRRLSFLYCLTDVKIARINLTLRASKIYFRIYMNILNLKLQDSSKELFGEKLFEILRKF